MKGVIMKKVITAGLAVLTLAGSGMIASQAMASETEAQGPMTAIVERISTKFGLNQDEVQSVFTQVREERQADRAAEQEQHLDQLVSDGEITAEQKQLILDKMAEMQSSREEDRDSQRDLSREDRQAEMEARRAEMDAWAEENGIDLEHLNLGGGPRGGRHGGQMRGN